MADLVASGRARALSTGDRDRALARALAPRLTQAPGGNLAVVVEDADRYQRLINLAEATDPTATPTPPST